MTKVNSSSSIYSSWRDRELHGPQLSQFKKDRGDISLKTNILSNENLVSRLKLKQELNEHAGCVNSIQWSHDGSLLVTGSDDCSVVVWSGNDYRLMHKIDTGHHRNIFCADFVPGSNCSKIVSCGMDGEIRISDLNEPNEGTPSKLLASYDHMVYKLSFLPFSQDVFVTTQQDGTARLYDLRSNTRYGEDESDSILVDLRDHHDNVSINSLAFSPLGSPDFVLGCSDPYVRMYDMRYVNKKHVADCVRHYCPQGILEKCEKDDDGGFYVTGVNYNSLKEIVATYSREDCYSFSLYQNHSVLKQINGTGKGRKKEISTQILQRYQGRRNVRTFLKEACFLGGNQFVGTGSDCGNIFIWEKKSGKLVQLLKGDESVVNGIVPHPYLPHLATCGIDSSGKVWEPSDHDTFNKKKADSLMDLNKNSEPDAGISLLQLWRFISGIRGRRAQRHSREEPQTRRRRRKRRRRAAGENDSEDDEGDEDDDDVDFEDDDVEDYDELQLHMDEDQSMSLQESEEEQEDMLKPIRLKLSKINEMREKANKFFKRERYDEALSLYNKALNKLSDITLPEINTANGDGDGDAAAAGAGGVDNQQTEQLRLQIAEARKLCTLNRAACNLKFGNNDLVIIDCSSVLHSESDNVKALFRRASAYVNKEEFKEASEDLEAALLIEPSNQNVLNLLQTVNANLDV